MLKALGWHDKTPCQGANRQGVFIYKGLVKMRFSRDRIKELQEMLLELTGRHYSEEETQEAGAAIVRFVVAKKARNNRKADNGQ